VSKSFSRKGARRPVEALREVSLDVPDNSFQTVLGPTGCGKTTLLRIVNGLIAPDAGEVSVRGRPPRPGPSIGFVFQSFRLLPWRTVAQNVEFALEVQSMARAERRARAAHHLERVGLGDFLNAYPAELSGGMKQRVALARALVTEPRLLLMDEPFASLDAQTRELMQLELLRIWQDLKCEVVFVTHSIDEAITLSDRIVLLGARPGHVIENLAVELPRPRWDYDLRAHPDFLAIRGHLWTRLKETVTSEKSWNRARG
jgi:NitT/TauT family transport system ATP-binding protein